MSDFFHVQKVADEATCAAQWSGGRNGKYFRCCFCGHKFVPGDKYRIIYTNDIKGGGGNPIVCEKCDGPNEDVRIRWLALSQEFRGLREGKFWSFVKHEE